MPDSRHRARLQGSVSVPSLTPSGAPSPSRPESARARHPRAARPPPWRAPHPGRCLGVLGSDRARGDGFWGLLGFLAYGALFSSKRCTGACFSSHIRSLVFNLLAAELEQRGVVEHRLDAIGPSLGASSVRGRLASAVPAAIRTEKKATWMAAAAVSAAASSTKVKAGARASIMAQGVRGAVVRPRLPGPSSSLACSGSPSISGSTSRFKELTPLLRAAARQRHGAGAGVLSARMSSSRFSGRGRCRGKPVARTVTPHPEEHARFGDGHDSRASLTGV